MNRLLRRLAQENTNEKEAIQLLDRIKDSSSALKDTYYVLFDNLNALYQTFPTIYQEIQQVVKLPNNKDAEQIVAFNNDLTRTLAKFEDKTYLSSFMKNSSETLD